MTDHITDKVVVITGASSGNGEASARHLAKLGATVVLAARRTERIDAIANELTEAGHKALAVTTDVSKQDQVEALIAKAIETYGRIDVLLNNAGLMPLSPLEELKTEEWEQMIDVNLKGTLYGIGAVLPHMKERKSGQIINVSSVYGHKVAQGAGVYCATKFGVRALSETLRQEVKPYNIRTTIISPGSVDTELLEHISNQEIQSQVKDYVKDFTLPPDSFARMVAFAIGEPDNVDVNEILFRPTAQEV